MPDSPSQLYLFNINSLCVWGSIFINIASEPHRLIVEIQVLIIATIQRCHLLTDQLCFKHCEKNFNLLYLVLLSCPLYRWGNWGWESLWNPLRPTCSENQIPAWACPVSKPHLSILPSSSQLCSSFLSKGVITLPCGWTQAVQRLSLLFCKLKNTYNYTLMRYDYYHRKV